MGENGQAIECLSQESLTPLLERKRNPEFPRKIPHFPLDSLLVTILEKANEFVPSASGSILLDDPRLKIDEALQKELIFVCSFGSRARVCIGERIPIGKGIAGSVYRTGISRITNSAYQSDDFNDVMDRRTGYTTQSILCVAIRIGQSICGVIELVNRQGGVGYQEAEKELLEIFAQYISSTIQNALDAKKIGKMVRTDDLTGLSNDRYLHERLPVDVETHVREGRPISVIFLDLDRFKQINDNHGHLAGSTTLAEFGRLLPGVVDCAAATLARYGGDEFVVLLPGTDAAGALSVAEKIRAATESHVFLSAPWGEAQPPLYLKGIITASIGVSTLSIPPETRTPREQMTNIAMKLLQAADQAMYASKERGKNTVSVFPFALPGE